MNFLWIACSILLLLQQYTIYAYELLEFGEGCPRDSILTNGICKCDHSLCDKPPCLFTLKLLTEFSNTPGTCCPTYTCDGCEDGDKFEGECPCASEAIIKLGRTCTCIDRHKKIINNECVCDLGKCELPDLCDEHSVGVREMDGCCEKTKCIPCPDDSYSTSYTEYDLVEDKCICFPCPETKCNETHTPQILRRGRNMPGSCCDIYKCVSIESKMGCKVNETLYSVGETWSSAGDICICQQNGISYCSHVNPTSEGHGFRTCLSGAKVYNHLDTWLLEDTCTNCTCNDGNVKCIAHMCDILTSEMKKTTTICPPLTACQKVCTNGLKVNQQGCDTCQCNDVEVDRFSLDQYYQVKELLEQHNLTSDAIIDIIKTLGQSGSFSDVTGGDLVTTITTTESSSSTTTSKPTGVPITRICSENNTTLGDCVYSCLLEYALPGFVIGTILGTIAVLSFRKCFGKNRKHYTMYMPVRKETPLDRNLNLSSIIKHNTKNFELQNYNEKKNAI